MPYPCCCVAPPTIVDCPLCIDGTAFLQIKITIAGVTGADAGYNGEYILDNVTLGSSSCEWQWSEGNLFVNFIINLTATTKVTYNVGFFTITPFNGITWSSAGIAADDAEDDCVDIDAMAISFNGFGGDWASATVAAEWI